MRGGVRVALAGSGIARGCSLAGLGICGLFRGELFPGAGVERDKRLKRRIIAGGEGARIAFFDGLEEAR